MEKVFYSYIKVNNLNYLNMKARIIFLLAILVLASCDNEQSITTKQSSRFERAGITSIEVIPASSPIVTAFTKTDFYKSLSSNFGAINLSRTEFMTLTTKNINFVKFYFDNSQLTMLAIYDNVRSEFVNAYVHEYRLESTKEYVNQYTTEGSKYLSLRIDSKTKAIESMSVNKMSNGRTQDWSSCMETAYNACSADWQCAIMCGLVFTECIAATALACAIVQL